MNLNGKFVLWLYIVDFIFRLYMEQIWFLHTLNIELFCSKLFWSLRFFTVRDKSFLKNKWPMFFLMFSKRPKGICDYFTIVRYLHMCLDKYQVNSIYLNKTTETLWQWITKDMEGLFRTKKTRANIGVNVSKTTFWLKLKNIKVEW